MEKQQLAEEAVNKIEEVFGKYPGQRRAHTRGGVYEASFSANGLGSEFTTAPHFRQGEVKALVRFSHFSPDPTWTDIMSPVKGMAVQFKLPDGGVTNIVSVTSPVFFAKTPEIFTEMVGIAKSFKKAKPRLRDLARLIKDYPESRSAIRVLWKMQAPASYSTGRYHSIHAFYFIDGIGGRQPVKYQWEPEDGVESLSVREGAAMHRGEYERELEDRLSKGTVNFNLNIILGEEGDPTDDPTRDWPAERKKVTIGRLMVTGKASPETESAVFDPTVMTGGIECSEDRILNFRHPAYSISHGRRMSENKNRER